MDLKILVVLDDQVVLTQSVSQRTLDEIYPILETESSSSRPDLVRRERVETDVSPHYVLVDHNRGIAWGPYTEVEAKRAKERFDHINATVERYPVHQPTWS
jgi:hypothetical protein